MMIQNQSNINNFGAYKNFYNRLKGPKYPFKYIKAEELETLLNLS